MMLARDRSTDGLDRLDIRIDQAFAKNALADHACRSENQYPHILIASGNLSGGASAVAKTQALRILTFARAKSHRLKAVLETARIPNRTSKHRRYISKIPVPTEISPCPAVPLTLCRPPTSILASGNVLLERAARHSCGSLRGPGMTDFRAKRAPSIPGRVFTRSKCKACAWPGAQKRRGLRVNSRVPIAVEWRSGGELVRKETQTRVVGPYGCMVVLPMNLEVSRRFN